MSAALGAKAGSVEMHQLPPPTQRDPLSAQYPPHVVFADITERLGQQMPRQVPWPAGGG